MPKETPTDAEMAVQGSPLEIGQLRRRKRNAVANTPFAGRIGGNQAFVATDDSEETEEILRKQPDAVCILKPYRF